jgi:hypothetical protein
MRGPLRGDEVTLVIPQRERIAARIDGAGLGWYSLWLKEAPRTPAPLLLRNQVYVQFTGIDGVGRMLGTIEEDEGDHRLRFRTRGGVQLMCRPEALRARVSVPVTVLRVNAADHVALEARTVEVGGGGLALRGLPTAAPGQLFQFDLHLFDHEQAISGQFRVQGVTADGVVLTRFTIMGARDRARLMQHLADAQPRRVA